MPQVRGHEWGTQRRELAAGELLAIPLMPQVRGHERGTRHPAFDRQPEQTAGPSRSSG